MEPQWNPFTQAQAIDRLHRRGQKSEVEIYTLVAEGTLEERVIQIQEKKRKWGSKFHEKGKVSHQYNNDETDIVNNKETSMWILFGEK